MTKHITTAELDDMARLGFDDLRACFSANAPEGAADRAELALKLLRQGTSRMSGENNRLAIAMKVAKMTGVPQEEQRILWKQIAGASSEAAQKTSEPLEAAKSEG